MKKLGLVGGTGPESTVLYYRSVIEGVQHRKGLEYLPELSIESLSVFRVLDFCSREDYDGLVAYLVAALERLAAAGAEFATLTGFTPHIVFDRLRDASPIPLVSAIEETCAEAISRGTARVALLGTEYTMTRDFFSRPLRAAGLVVVTPNAEEVAYIQDRIVRELEHGAVTDGTRDGFVRIIERLRAEEGAEQVILGCTELPLLLDDTSSPLPCLDTVEIHTRALVTGITDA